jgi:uncharacterized protein (TIGR03790 family)
MDKDGTADSVQLARYYALKRNVPAVNLLPVNISIGSRSAYAKGEYAQFYTDIVTPIVGRLKDLGPTTIDVILLAGDVPKTVYDSVGLARSTDSLLAAINTLTSQEASITILTNPYFEASPSFGTDRGNFRHVMYTVGGTDMYLVNRLGGDWSLRGIDQIDNALYAEYFLSVTAGGYHGSAYVDTQYGLSGKSYTEEVVFAQPAVQAGSFNTSADADLNLASTAGFAKRAGLSVRWENTTAGVRIGEVGAKYSDGTPAAAAPRALFYAGWYNFNRYNDVYEWLPGSFASDVNSAPKFGQAALSKGASAASYVVAEPYLSGHQRPNVIIYYLLKGYNYAEASALGTPYLRWMNVNEGDPLYTPLSASKILRVDSRIPALKASYPQVTVDTAKGFATIKLAVDDSMEPEVVKAVVEYGTTAIYGSSVSSSGFSRTPSVDLPWVPGQTYYYRVILTDPVGNVTTGDYVYAPETAGVKIITPASAAPATVAGLSTIVSVLAGGDNEATLTYTWSATGPAPVVFAGNGTNAASQTSVTFSKAGTYVVQVIARSFSGSTALSSVTVQVVQTCSFIRVSPSSATVPLGGSQLFSATVTDQFGQPAAMQTVWTVSGGGTVSAAGAFTSDGSPGELAIKATAGAVSGTAAVVVTSSTSSEGASTQPANGVTFHLRGQLAELSGTNNGAVVTPATGIAGKLILKGTGGVRFESATTGNGVYFLRCCSNTDNAYYLFSGETLGSIFRASGEISFNIRSRHSWIERQAAGSYRAVFDAVDGQARHLFGFWITAASGRLSFNYRMGSSQADYYVIPAGTEDQLFNKGVTAAVKLSWDGAKRYLYVNGRLVKTSPYTAVLPSWTQQSLFTVGAQQYMTFGGYNSADDIINELTVSQTR